MPMRNTRGLFSQLFCHICSAIEVGRSLYALNQQHPEGSSPLAAALPALLVDAWLFFFGLVMLLAEDLSFAGDFRRGLTRRYECFL